MKELSPSSQSFYMSSKIRIGLIGVGNWAAYGHIPALRSLATYEITAVSSRHLDRANELARAFKIPHAFAEAEDLIQHPDVDLVAVLPPVPEHARLSRQVVAAGKSLYCEWPLTTSTAESTELLTLAIAAGIDHVTGLQRRMGASARFVQDLIDEGFIGELRSVRMHVSIQYF